MATEPRIEDAPVDEATRFAESRVAKACSHVLFALVVFYSLAALYLFMVKPRIFLEMFDEMNTELPVCTKMFLFLRPLAVGLVFLLLIGSAAKEFAVKERRVTLILNAVHLAALVLMKELADIALYMPLMTLMDALK